MRWIEKRDTSYYVAEDGEILGTVQEHGGFRNRYYYVSSFANRRLMEARSYITREFAKRAIEKHVAEVTP